MRPVGPSILALLLLATPIEANAQDTTAGEDGEAHEGGEPSEPPAADLDPAADRRARELYHLGDSLYARGRYAAAIEAFSEAYELSRRPLLLFNLANAQERSGQLSAAIESLSEYRQHITGEELATVEARIVSLRERAASEAVIPPSEEPPTEPPPIEETAIGSDRDPVSVEAGETSADPPAGPDLVAPIAVLAIGAGFGVLAGVFGGVALGARSELDAACGATAGGLVCTTRDRQAIDDDAIFSGLADAALGLTVIGLGVGIYLLIDALSGGAASETRAFLPRPGGVATTF